MGYTDFNYDFAGIGALQKQDADSGTTDAPREVATFVDER